MQSLSDRIERVEFRLTDRLAVSVRVERTSPIDASSVLMTLNMFDKVGRLWDVSVDGASSFSGVLEEVQVRVKEIENQLGPISVRPPVAVPPVDGPGEGTRVQTESIRTPRLQPNSKPESGESEYGSFFPFMKAKRSEKLSHRASSDSKIFPQSDDLSAANYQFYDENDQTVSYNEGFENTADFAEMPSPDALKSVKKIHSTSNILAGVVTPRPVEPTGQARGVDDLKWCLDTVCRGLELFEETGDPLSVAQRLLRGELQPVEFEKAVLKKKKLIQAAMSGPNVEDLERRFKNFAAKNVQKDDLFLKLGALLGSYTEVGNGVDRLVRLGGHVQEMLKVTGSKGEIFGDRLIGLKADFMRAEEKVGKLMSKLDGYRKMDGSVEPLMGTDGLEAEVEALTESAHQICQKKVESLVQDHRRETLRQKEKESIRRDHHYLLSKLAKAIDRAGHRSGKELDRMKLSVENLAGRLAEVQERLGKALQQRPKETRDLLKVQEEQNFFAQEFGGAKRLTDSEANSPGTSPRFQPKFTTKVYRPGDSFDDDEERAEGVLLASPKSKQELSIGFSVPFPKDDDSDFMDDVDSPRNNQPAIAKGAYDFRNIPYFEAKEDERSANVPEMDAEPNHFQSQLLTEHKASKNDHTMDQSVAYQMRERTLASVVNLVRQFLDLRGRPSKDLTEENISRVLATILNEFEDLEIAIEELRNGQGGSLNNIEIMEPSSKDSNRESHRAPREPQAKPRLWQNLHISVAENEESDRSPKDRPEDPFSNHKDRLLDQAPPP